LINALNSGIADMFEENCEKQFMFLQKVDWKLADYHFDQIY
jgi:hypothetical protein